LRHADILGHQVERGKQADLERAADPQAIAGGGFHLSEQLVAQSVGRNKQRPKEEDGRGDRHHSRNADKNGSQVPSRSLGSNSPME
jgi:hypothetical protein